jgi:hypothetical protein
MEVGKAGSHHGSAKTQSTTGKEGGALNFRRGGLGLLREVEVMPDDLRPLLQIVHGRFVGRADANDPRALHASRPGAS